MTETPPNPWAHHAVQLPPEVEGYLTQLSGSASDAIIADLLIETFALPTDPASGFEPAGFGVPPLQGALLASMIQFARATRVLELGTFTGLSTLMMARALPQGGTVTTIDTNSKTTRIALKYWERAGVGHKINVIERPAMQVLNEMVDAAEIFNFAFVDADKGPTLDYINLLLPMMASDNGLIVVDNALARGEVANPNSRDWDAAVFERVNRLVLEDDRLNAMLLPLFDGLLVIRPRY